MPLILFLSFFAVLFFFEYVYYLAKQSNREQEMKRYERVEHPRRYNRDCYLDRF